MIYHTTIYLIIFSIYVTMHKLYDHFLFFYFLRSRGIGNFLGLPR
jgi:hypothetical protein